MNIFLNDEERTVNDEISLTDLVQSLGFSNHNGIAIAVNQQIIPAAKWLDTALRPNDRIMMVRAIQGG